MIVSLCDKSDIAFVNSDDWTNALKFFDIGNLFLGIISLLKFYQYFLKDYSNILKIEMTAKANKISKHIPFIDCEGYLGHVEKFGFPIIKEDLIEIAMGNGRGILFDCKYDSALSMGILGLLSVSFGLPIDVASKIITESIVNASKFS